MIFLNSNVVSLNHYVINKPKTFRKMYKSFFLLLLFGAIEIK